MILSIKIPLKLTKVVIVKKQCLVKRLSKNSIVNALKEKQCTIKKCIVKRNIRRVYQSKILLVFLQNYNIPNQMVFKTAGFEYFKKR